MTDTARWISIATATVPRDGYAGPSSCPSSRQPQLPAASGAAARPLPYRAQFLFPSTLSGPAATSNAGHRHVRVRRCLPQLQPLIARACHGHPFTPPLSGHYQNPCCDPGSLFPGRRARSAARQCPPLLGPSDYLGRLRRPPGFQHRPEALQLAPPASSFPVWHQPRRPAQRILLPGAVLPGRYRLVAPLHLAGKSVGRPENPSPVATMVRASATPASPEASKLLDLGRLTFFRWIRAWR